MNDLNHAGVAVLESLQTSRSGRAAKLKISLVKFVAAWSIAVN